MLEERWWNWPKELETQNASFYRIDSLSYKNTFRDEQGSKKVVVPKVNNDRGEMLMIILARRWFHLKSFNWPQNHPSSKYPFNFRISRVTSQPIQTNYQFHQHFTTWFFILNCVWFSQFVLCFFWQKEIIQKAAWKVLVQLAKERKNKLYSSSTTSFMGLSKFARYSFIFVLANTLEQAS